MIAWVVYDIKNDKVRSKVAKICKKYGLYRVQKSVFLGTLENENEKESLEIEISDLINHDIDSVYIFPMSKRELKQTVLLGQAFDKKLISDEVKALFL
jgi:CRISPR-associated protein Cas2